MVVDECESGRISAGLSLTASYLDLANVSIHSSSYNIPTTEELSMHLSSLAALEADTAAELATCTQQVEVNSQEADRVKKEAAKMAQGVEEAVGELVSFRRVAYRVFRTHRRSGTSKSSSKHQRASVNISSRDPNVVVKNPRHTN